MQQHKTASVMVRGRKHKVTLAQNRAIEGALRNVRILEGLKRKYGNVLLFDGLAAGLQVLSRAPGREP